MFGGLLGEITAAKITVFSQAPDGCGVLGQEEEFTFKIHAAVLKIDCLNLNSRFSVFLLK